MTSLPHRVVVLVVVVQPMLDQIKKPQFMILELVKQ
jgi:hypothetical protein